VLMKDSVRDRADSVEEEGTALPFLAIDYQTFKKRTSVNTDKPTHQPYSTGASNFPLKTSSSLEFIDECQFKPTIKPPNETKHKRGGNIYTVQPSNQNSKTNLFESIYANP